MHHPAPATCVPVFAQQCPPPRWPPSLLLIPENRWCSHNLKGLFAPYFRGRPFETLLVAGLDDGGRLIAFVEQPGSRGRVEDATLAVRRALGSPAASTLVLAHNHPDGPAQPSASDKLATRNLARLARAANATLIDHLIFAGDDWFSFAENQLI